MASCDIHKVVFADGAACPGCEADAEISRKVIPKCQGAKRPPETSGTISRVSLLRRAPGGLVKVTVETFRGRLWTQKENEEAATLDELMGIMEKRGYEMGLRWLAKPSRPKRIAAWFRRAFKR